MRFGRRQAITLLVHIGAAKCGSTAIQQFLALNRDRLGSRGFIVPGSDLSADGDGADHHLAYFARQPDDEMCRDLTGRLRALERIARERGSSTIVLSSENLINPHGFASLFETAAVDLRVRVLAFVRRQDDYLASAWQQWHLKQFDSLDDYLGEYTGAIDWHMLLSPWRHSFGVESIEVCRYLPEIDVIDDLCRVLRLDANDYLRPQPSNVSIDERFAQIAHRHRNELFENAHDNRFFDYLQENLGERALKQYSGSSLLSLEQRLRIVADHEPANERLRSTHLRHLSAREPVFSAPTESDVCLLEPAAFSDAEAHRIVTEYLRSVGAHLEN